jgi:hypothetical protein
MIFLAAAGLYCKWRCAERIPRTGKAFGNAALHKNRENGGP